ncbi:FAD-dependent monooxygenase [Streptomyces sp. NPDC086023]|uniref:FAD-dependent monooxygenase n=1 Tax=Streptomyces sp. NPDC086023 TaxID=3365746 RepID=UPI0037CD4902
MPRSDSFAEPDVLVVGAGPVGLTAAVELRRRGVRCRLVDRLPARLMYAKAVGVQPRTLEVWDRMGCVREVLEAAVRLRGHLVYVNGEERERAALRLPPEVPYGFAALPQYETERLLEEYLERLGGRIERGTELVSFRQDADGVTSVLAGGGDGTEEVRSRFLVGCDGAHSLVRKGLGLSFEGGAFPEGFMLGDVRVDWDLPAGYALRSLHRDASGAVDDVLVAVPLPGGRYRLSMMVPPALAGEGDAGGDGVAHGLQGESGRLPALADLQAVVERLSPRPAALSDLRWSSVFRISHRIVDRYGSGRVFVAGDAAHIHPPTGGQGMNTGIQDAYNLAWKLALAVGGDAHPGLTASYDAERRPVGEEVVGRTVRNARQQEQAAPDDPAAALLREAQLLVGYRDGPLTLPAADGGPGPRPGDRAPDCAGLTTGPAAFPLRLYDVLRGREHVLLVYADGPDAGAALDRFAAETAALTDGRLELCGVLGADAGPYGGDRLPVYRDAEGAFARLYGAGGRPTAFAVRPDGYLGARISPPARGPLAEYLAAVFAAR